MTERKMTRGKLLAVGGGAAGVALAGKATAFGSADAAQVGSWHAVVTFTDPPGLGSIDELITLGGDGTVVEARRFFIPYAPKFGPLLGTSGHGSWKPSGNSKVAVAYRVVIQKAEPSGEIVGIDHVSLGLQVDGSGDKISGSFLGARVGIGDEWVWGLWGL